MKYFLVYLALVTSFRQRRFRTVDCEVSSDVSAVEASHLLLSPATSLTHHLHLDSLQPPLPPLHLTLHLVPWHQTPEPLLDNTGLIHEDVSTKTIISVVTIFAKCQVDEAPTFGFVEPFTDTLIFWIRICFMFSILLWFIIIVLLIIL